MTALPSEHTVLVDGPMAGHLYRVPASWMTWVVRIPKPLNLFLTTDPAAVRTLTDDTVYYRIETVGYYNDLGYRAVRIGYTASQRPDDGALMEYVPTALAEQGILMWEEVPATALDRASPIPVETHGDVLKTCAVKLGDSYGLLVGELDASCACGWRTGRVALDRRSQLVRAARGHEIGERSRRERYRAPILATAAGSGAQADCYGGVAVDEAAERVFGRCRRCGWQTERVEHFRIGPLRKLCQAHTGRDGVRRVRDQLLAAYGLPPAALVPVDPAPQMWGVHDDKYFAGSHADEPGWGFDA